MYSEQVEEEVPENNRLTFSGPEYKHKILSCG